MSQDFPVHLTTTVSQEKVFEKENISSNNIQSIDFLYGTVMNDLSTKKNSISALKTVNYIKRRHRNQTKINSIFSTF